MSKDTRDFLNFIARLIEATLIGLVWYGGHEAWAIGFVAYHILLVNDKTQDLLAKGDGEK